MKKISEPKFYTTVGELKKILENIPDNLIVESDSCNTDLAVVMWQIKETDEEDIVNVIKNVAAKNNIVPDFRTITLDGPYDGIELNKELNE